MIYKHKLKFIFSENSLFIASKEIVNLEKG